MNDAATQFINEANSRGKQRKAFAFLIDFDFQKPRLFSFNHSCDEICWEIPGHKHRGDYLASEKDFSFTAQSIHKDDYQKAFQKVQQEIAKGNSYLLNLTFPTTIKTNYSLEDLFYHSDAPYKVLLRNQFVCFSPEIFVRIKEGIISSYPMKGTIDARLENAELILRNDPKELAEHNTIVDLIRNDLSRVAEQVVVEKFRYIDRIKTNKGELLQVSSKITGRLPDDYCENIGTIIGEMLPAGSICGAPKKETVRILKEAEQYERGYYSGIFGVFDGKNMDSCVLIRFIEQTSEGLLFKSGGGITYLSDCQTEYNELIQKVYVPIIGNHKA